jgi:ABC-2 type transport system permease protein
MRAVLVDKHVRGDLMLGAAALNVVYIALGAVIYLAVFRLARRHGLLLQQGE